MTPGIPKYKDSASIAANSPTSFRDLPLLATYNTPYICSAICSNGKRISIEISLEDEINLIEHIYRTAKEYRLTPWIKRKLQDTLRFHIRHQRLGRLELATQFCIDHGFDLHTLGDSAYIPMSIWVEALRIENKKKEAVDRRIKVFTWCYVPLAVLGLVLLMFNILPRLEWLHGEHNNPNCPDLVYDAVWFALSLIVIPLCYASVTASIGYMIAQTIQSCNPLKSLITRLISDFELYLVPLAIISGCAILIFLLWLFSTQFWVWIVVLGPAMIANALFGKRR